MKRLLSLILAVAMLLAVGAVAAAEEKVTLDVVVGGNVASFFPGEDENNNYMIKYIEENTGYDVVWHILPLDNPDAKLNAMMTSPTEAPDIIIQGNRDLFLNYAADEMIINLDEYIGDPAVYFNNDAVNANAMGMLDGSYYAVATPGNQSSTTYMWWYNKAALTDASIELPAHEITLEEFDAILYKLKEAYPDKIILGSASDGSTSPWVNSMQQIYATFGIANDFRVDDNGDLEYAMSTEDMKEGLQYLNKLYTDGILDPEFIVTTKDTLLPKLMDGSCVSAMFAWYDYTGTYSKNIGNNNNIQTGEIVPEDEYAWEYVNIIDGGKATKGQTMGAVNQHYIMVSYACEYPQEAVNLINFLLQPEYYDKVFFGEEGVDYYFDENGTRWRNPETAIGSGFTVSGTQWYVYYYFYESAEQRVDRLKTGAPGYHTEHNMTAWYDVKLVPNPIVNMPVIDSYVESKVDIDDVAASYFIKFIVGDYGFDKWDDMKAELEAVGLNEVLADLNAWYDTL